MPKTCLLLTNKSDLKAAKKSPKRWQAVLPGHHQLYVMANLDGLNVVNPNRLVPVSEYEAICKDVASNLHKLQIFLHDYAAEELAAYIMARAVRQLYLVNLVNFATKHGFELFRRDYNNQIIRASMPVEENLFSKSSLQSFVDIKEPYVLDMQSPSGKKRQTFTSKHLSAKLSFASSFDILKHRILKKNDKSILLTAVPGSEIVLSSKFEKMSEFFTQEVFSALYNLIKNIEINYNNSYLALEKFYSQNELPREAWFNFVKNTQMAALMTFLNKKGVPVKMQSHGGLHVFGTEDQKFISSLLSDGMYNNYPAASEIHLRSTFQANNVYGEQRIKVQYQPRSILKKASNKKFTILFAPNFLNWWEANWGIHSTCFDIVKVLKHLASLSDQTDDFEVHVRIKLGLSDTQQKLVLGKMIGIDPGSVGRVFVGRSNIKDVTHESYDDCMVHADLVVTEGMTSVIYDAIERHTPVLCLRADREVRGLAAGNQPGLTDRAVVYSDSILDFGLSKLKWLRCNHKEKPLTNEEVSNFLRGSKN